MDIRHLREWISGPAVMLLIAVTAACGVLAGLFTHNFVKADHQAVGNVSVVQVAGRVPSFDMATWTADFLAVFGAESTAAAAQKAAGGNHPGELVGAGTADSSVVKVSYTAGSPEAARAGLQAAVRSDLLVLADQAVTRAQLELTAATTRQAKAVQDLQAIRAKVGGLTADELAAEYRKAVAEQRPDAATLAANLGVLQLRQRNVDDANTTVGQALDKSSVATATRAGLATQEVVTIESVTALSTLMAVIRSVVTAMIGGFIAAAGLLFATGRLRRRPATATPAAAAPDAATDTATDTPPPPPAQAAERPLDRVLQEAGWPTLDKLRGRRGKAMARPPSPESTAEHTAANGISGLTKSKR